MRRTVLAALALGVGVAGMAMLAHGYARQRLWQSWDERTRVVYLVGYFDGVGAGQRKDAQSFLPVAGKPDFEDWRVRVDKFFSDPENAGLSIPHAIAQVSRAMQQQRIEVLRKRHRRKYGLDPAPFPSPAGE